MLGWVAMLPIVSDLPRAAGHRRESGHASCAAASRSRRGRPILVRRKGFVAAPTATTAAEGDLTMIFAALLVPFGLLAVLLGMERLERWTVRDSDDS